MSKNKFAEAIENLDKLTESDISALVHDEETHRVMDLVSKIADEQERHEREIYDYLYENVEGLRQVREYENRKKELRKNSKDSEK